MRVNRRQKIKILTGVIMTFYVLFVLPWMGLSLTPGSRVALLFGVWLAVAAAFWYRRDRV